MDPEKATIIGAYIIGVFGVINLILQFVFAKRRDVEERSKDEGEGAAQIGEAYQGVLETLS